MSKVMFESQLLQDGHLYCPQVYATPKAKFEVFVSIPEDDEMIAERKADGKSTNERSEFEKFMAEVHYVNPGRKFSREGMNAR
jgi:hypothetical protein